MFLYNLTKNYGWSWLSGLFGTKPDDRNFLSYTQEEKEKEHTSARSVQDELEQIASDFLANEEWKTYGIVQEVSEDLPSQESPVDDNYYSTAERAQYEVPRASFAAQNQPSWSIRWQRGTLLGEGSFGTVLLGLNLDNGELLAIKQVAIPDNQVVGNQKIEALQQEINVLRILQHENIVRYLGSSVEGSYVNIFLEYVPGGSIASFLKRFGKLNENLIRKFTKQILQGLEYLHNRQIIHRDIKGENILADDKGVIKLADFGASKILEDLVGSCCHSLKGTTYWMAPEVIKQCGYGRQADIWSLGCTVLEMATGEPPWSKKLKEPIIAMFAIATSNEIPPIPNGLSSDCVDFLLQCFRRDPSTRPNAKKLLSHPWITSSPLPSPNMPSEEFQGLGFPLSPTPQQYPYHNLLPYPTFTQQVSPQFRPQGVSTKGFMNTFHNPVPQLRLPEEKFKPKTIKNTYVTNQEIAEKEKTNVPPEPNLLTAPITAVPEEPNKIPVISPAIPVVPIQRVSTPTLFTVSKSLLASIDAPVQSRDEENDPEEDSEEEEEIEQMITSHTDEESSKIEHEEFADDTADETVEYVDDTAPFYIGYAPDASSDAIADNAANDAAEDGVEDEVRETECTNDEKDDLEIRSEDRTKSVGESRDTSRAPASQQEDSSADSVKEYNLDSDEDEEEENELDDDFDEGDEDEDPHGAQSGGEEEEILGNVEPPPADFHDGYLDAMSLEEFAVDVPGQKGVRHPTLVPGRSVAEYSY